jgi:hypothetical protein
MNSVLLMIGATLAQDPAASEQARPPLLARDAEGFGVGIILGAPTGLSLGWRPGNALTYDAAVAWSFARGSLSTHFDVRMDIADAGNDDFPDTSFPIYVGVGPRLRLGDVVADGQDADFDLGIRVPVGMGIIHDNVPIEGFVELVPGVGLYPETAFLFDAALGIRMYFPAGG